MERLAKNKSIFIGLSCLSISCLVGSFAYPLQKLEVWRQPTLGAFQTEYERRFIITESDLNYPYGFQKGKAELIAQIYQDYKLQKLFLLICAFSSALSALSIGNEICLADEIDSEVTAIKAKGRKQLLLEGVKHRLAMASKSQRLLFMDEMKALMEEFGSAEGEILEVDELNATDKFVAASYLMADGLELDAVISQVWGCQPGTSDHERMKQKFTNWQGEDESDSDASEGCKALSIDFRGQFPESMDATCWKGICKALGEGLSKSDIVADVLGCKGNQTAVGMAYFDYLQERALKG